MKSYRTVKTALVLLQNISLIFVLLLISNCKKDDEPSCRDENLTNLYISAIRNPESFDNFITESNIPNGMSDCFRDLSNQLRNMEQAKLQECGLIVTGSPLWNECHNEAEHLNNSSIIAGDIANAIDGAASFSNTQSANYLIFIKSFLGPAEYELLIDEFAVFSQEMNCTICE